MYKLLGPIKFEGNSGVREARVGSFTSAKMLMLLEIVDELDYLEVKKVYEQWLEDMGKA